MMEPIRLLDIGLAPAVRSQTIYHAVAYALDENSPDTIILVAPSEPYVCIGFHQELDKEVEVAYCRAHGLPIYRREVGGGAGCQSPGVTSADLTTAILQTGQA